MQTIRVIQTLEALEELRVPWQDLVARTAGALVFQVPDWAIGWWWALQPASQLFCIGLFDKGELVGFAPLCIVKVLGTRVVQCMGGAANDVIQFPVKAGYAHVFGRALGDVLRERRAEWDAILLVPTSLHNPLMEAVHATVGQWGVKIAMRQTPLLWIEVPTLWQDYWQSLSPKRTKKWMYSRRHLARRGSVSFRVLSDGDALQDGIRQLLRVREQNWQQKNRAAKLVSFQRTGLFEDTLVAVSSTLAAREQVWLGQLCLDGTPIGWELVLRIGNTMWEYLTTYDLKYAVYSPGLWVALEMIRHATMHGITHCYLGRGNQAYKLWMGAQAGFDHPLLVAQINVRGLAFLAHTAAYERAAQVYHALRGEHGGGSAARGAL